MLNLKQPTCLQGDIARHHEIMVPPVRVCGKHGSHLCNIEVKPRGK
jgi:hypothetical protein